MQPLNNKKEDIDRSNYLIQKIFIYEDSSKPNDIVKINSKNNFNLKNLYINNSILESIKCNQKITLFNKTYTNKELGKYLYKFNKLIYFCYRRNIYPITTKTNNIITRDSGWGCMIRCGQMIMSRAIYKYLKSKNFSSEKAIYETIKYFLDIPYSEKGIPSIFSSILSKNQRLNIKNFKIFPPFSIHIHCFLGLFYKKHAGEWFSDVNISQNYRDINKIFDLFPELNIFSFITDFNLNEILDECFTLVDNNYKDNSKKIFTLNNKQYIMKKCGLIFISVRLGIQKITREYYFSLKKVFECKECIGIIGGETNLAHYFIGYNDKGNLIYLDPHITREAVCNLNDDSITNDYLVKNIHEISIDGMSTALSIGFLFRNDKEFEDLIQFLDLYNKNSYPCFGYLKEKIELNIDTYENLFNDEDDF